MADAQFTFETNIRQISREVSQGLSEISNATRASSGASAGDFTAGLSAGIERDVKKSIKFLEDLNREFQRLAEQGKSHPSGQSFAELGQTELERLRGSTQSKIQTRAVQFQAKGGDIGTLDLSAYYRQIDKSLIARVANTTRALTRDIEKAGTPQQQAIYGSPATIAPLARARETPNLGTVDSLSAAKAAEQTRIANEKAADRQRKADESAADKERKANEKAADKQRKDAEQAATRKQKLDESAADKERKANEADAEKQRKANEKAAQAAQAVQEKAAQKAAAETEAQRRLQETTAANQARPGVNPRGTLAQTEQAEQALAIALEQRARDVRRDAKEGLAPADTRIVTDSVRAHTEDGITRYFQQDFAKGTASEIDPNDSAQVPKFLKVAREDAYQQAVALATLETDRVARAEGSLYDSLVREAAAYEKRGRFQAVTPDQPETRFVDKNSLIRQTEAGTEHFGSTGKNQVRLLDPTDAADAARIKQINTADEANRSAAEANAYIEALREEKERTKAAAATAAQDQTRLHDALVQLALAYEKRKSAEAVERGAPDVRYVDKNSFIRQGQQGPEYFDNVAKGRVRELDPRNSTDAARITEIQKADALNQATALLAAQRQTQAELAQHEAQVALDLGEEERRLSRVYANVAEDVVANARKGVRGEDTGVRRVDATSIVDTRSGQNQVLVSSPSGGLREVSPTAEPELFRRKIEADDKNQISAREIAYGQALNEAAKDQRSQNQATKDLTREIETAHRRGLVPNFLAGLNNPGFGGGGGGGGFAGNFDGLARSAGQTLKYSALYSGLNLLQQAAGAAASEFLDFNDSITELDVAMGGTSQITGSFLNQLQDFAAVGGFNVGEAMDVAASGVRAFGDEVRKSGGDIDTLGADFAQQAGRLAVLSKTTLTDSAGNLKAVASGFGLPKNSVGFSQVTDAIAGAKLAGGGDETQIFQGLANSALTFKELGFSLNEAATIISKINAETDQSGTLIASRVSRLGQIIGGTSGKSLLSDLNTQLQPEQRIDTTASIRDQVLKLSEVYGKLSEAQRQTVNSRLGGQANARELIILLQQLGGPNGLAAKADAGFTGKGAEEFQKRLENVRAQLTQIQGNVKAIVVNLAASGLAVPFVGLVEILRLVTGAMREITQAVAGLVHNLQPVLTFIAPLATIAATLRGLAAIKAAGGISNAIAAVEARVAPGRAIHRAELEDRARLAAEEARRGQGITEGVSLVGAGGLTQARTDLAAAPGDLAVRTRVAAGELDAAAAELAQANARLLAAERELAIAQELVRTEQGLGAVTGGTAARVATAETEVGAAQTVRDKAIVGVATGNAGLERAQARESAGQVITTRFKDARDTLAKDLEDASLKISKKIETAEGRGDTARVAQLRQKQLQLEEAYTLRLQETTAAESAARAQAVAAAERSRLAVAVDNVGLGGVRAAGGRIAEAEGVGATARVAGKELAGGLKGVLSGGLGLVGGPIGLALIVGTLATAVKGGLDDIRKNTGEAATQAAGTGGIEPTVAALRAAGEANLAGGKNLKDSTSGFIGTIADFVNRGRGGDQARRSTSLGTLQKAQADAIEKQQGISARSPDATVAAAALDFTSADTLSTGLKALSDAGQTASQRMAALTTAVSDLAFGAEPIVNRLSGTQRQQLAADTGTAGRADIEYRRTEAQNAVDAATFVDHDANRGRITKTRADEIRAARDRGNAELQRLQGVDPEKVRTIEENATQQFFKDNPSANLSQKTVQDAYKAYITKQLRDATIKPEAIPELAADASKNLQSQVQSLATQLSDPKQVANAIPSLIATATAVGDQVEAQAKLAALRSGNVRDTSALQGVTARQALLRQSLVVAKQAVDAAVAKGDGYKATEGAVLLQTLQTELDKTEADALQAITHQAQVDIATGNKHRQHDLALAGTSTQVRAIIDNAASAGLDTAVGSNDKDTIVDAINNHDKKTVDAERKLLQSRVDKAKARLKTLQTLNSHLGPDDRAELGPAQAALNAALAAQGVFTAAEGEATPGSGSNPLTGPQLNAAKQSAAAVKARDSHAGLVAAVKKASADYDAALRGGGDEQAALQALAEAKNNLADNEQQIADAVKDASAFPDSAVTTATREIRTATEALKKYGKDSLEYKQALAELSKGQRDLALAQIDQTLSITQATGDLSDPIAQGQAKQKDLKAKLAYDTALLKKNPKNTNAQQAVRDDTIALHQQDITNETDRHSEVESHADALLAAGKISHAAYIGLLTAERSQLQEKLKRTKEGTNQYVQFQKEILETEGKIRSAAGAAAGQFNLGDIKVPTVYEVRRSLQNSTAATSSINSAVVANTTNNTITFNGADLAKMEAVVRQMVGHSNRYTVAGRKA